MGDVTVVKLRGRLSLREGQEFLGAIFSDGRDNSDRTERPVERDVIVDLSGVSDMSSWGFALICGLAQKLAASGRSLRIAGPSTFVKKYLDMFTDLKQPIEFHSTREDALRARGCPRPPRLR